MNRIALEAKNISYEHKGNIILNKSSFTARCNEITYINSEDDTILYILYGLIKPDIGKINVFDFNLAQEETYIKNSFGFMLINNSFKNLKVLDYFKYSSKFYVGSYIDNAKEYLAKFNIDLTLKMKSLTTEQRTIIAFIEAIYFNPEVIILNDPFKNLSDSNIDLVKNVICELKDHDKAIIYLSDINYEFYDKQYIIENNSLKEVIL